MEYRILSLVIEELAGILPGARVDKAVPVKDDGLVLLLHQKRKNYFLFLAPDRIRPSIHLISRKPTATPSTAPFFLSLKKYLTGSRISGIRLVNLDRVVEMRFSRLDGETFLILELIGSASNLILTDGGLRIIAVHRPAPPGDRVMRPLVPGITYEPPPVRLPVERASRSSMNPAALRETSSDLAVNKAVERIFEELLAERDRSSLRQSLLTTVRKARARTERRREAVQADLAAAEKGADYLRMGELILSNLTRIERGQERVELPDHDGALRAIALDPSRAPAENADRYFKKYKKAKAGLAVLRERLGASQAEMEYLAGVQGEVEAAVDLEALQAVRRMLVTYGLVRDKAGSRGERPDRSAPPYRTATHEGWEILIGRSAAGNDYVTMQLARPDDLWLHAEGMPGSHVLVRNPEKRDIPPVVLRKAASLAAFYSKGRGSTKVSVAYTQAKYVRKPQGAAPGTVVLTQRKSIMAAPEPAERGLGNAT